MRYFMGLAGGSLAVLQVQYDHGVCGFAAAATPQKGPHAAERQSADKREAQQYTDQNKGVDHQVADIVTARGDALVEGDVRVITNEGQQFLGSIGIGRRQNHDAAEKLLSLIRYHADI